MIVKVKVTLAAGGRHDRVTVFAGPEDGTLANVGTLFMLPAETTALLALLQSGADSRPDRVDLGHRLVLEVGGDVLPG